MKVKMGIKVPHGVHVIYTCLLYHSYNLRGGVKEILECSGSSKIANSFLFPVI